MMCKSISDVRLSEKTVLRGAFIAIVHPEKYTEFCFWGRVTEKNNSMNISPRYNMPIDKPFNPRKNTADKTHALPLPRSRCGSMVSRCVQPDLLVGPTSA
jgi:hypothetical protein